ncbi:hypothetical protein N7528_001309 [Penicillium herquei]|nr:hypothetical protein N7528_001309 [Penicillium herquei]
MTSLYLVDNEIGIPIRDQIHNTNRRQPRATTKTIDLVGGTITPQRLGKIGSKVAATNKAKTRGSKSLVQIPHGVNTTQISTPIFGKLLVEKKNVGRMQMEMFLCQRHLKTTLGHSLMCLALMVKFGECILARVFTLCANHPSRRMFPLVP